MNPTGVFGYHLRFCSLSCRRKLNPKTRKQICEVCGKEFETPTYNYITHCSRRCSAITIVLKRGDKLKDRSKI